MSGVVSGFDDEKNIIWDPAFFRTLDGVSLRKAQMLFERALEPDVKRYRENAAFVATEKNLQLELEFSIHDIF